MKPVILSLILMMSTMASIASPEANTDFLVSTEWLAEHLNDSNLVILQAGMKEESYKAGHIPGARFIAWNKVATTRDDIPNELPPAAELSKWIEDAGIDETKRVVIYDDMGGLAASRVWIALEYMGLVKKSGQKPALLDGHLAKWKNENHPMTDEYPSVKKSEYTPAIQTNLLVSLPTLQDLVWNLKNNENADIVIIDSRPKEQYSGETPGDGISRGGHIPGAKHSYWQENLESMENPVMKPVEDLRKMYPGGEGTTFVTYCRTGGQASHSYFTLRYLGFQPLLYDGSFIEWSNAEGTEVETGEKDQ